MINALIIDDEQHCIDRLANLVKQYHQDVVLVAVATSVKDGLQAIAAYQPQLLFLDVQLKDGTGFDLLRQCEHINFKIIFTTAFDKFAIEAIKFSAIGYLLKPVDEEELQQALDKIKATSVEQTRQMANIIDINMNQAIRKKRLTVPVGNELLFLNIDDIVRCHSDINYTTIFKNDKQKIVVAKTLKEFEEMLTGCDFFRIHNSDLINLSFLKSYNRGKGGSVTLTDGTELEVSTRRKDDFLKKINSL